MAELQEMRKKNLRREIYVYVTRPNEIFNSNTKLNDLYVCCMVTHFHGYAFHETVRFHCLLSISWGSWITYGPIANINPLHSNVKLDHIIGNVSFHCDKYNLLNFNQYQILICRTKNEGGKKKIVWLKRRFVIKSILSLPLFEMLVEFHQHAN